MGELVEEASDELELGNLEWPREENVGVGGSETSEAIQYELVERSAERVTSSVEWDLLALVANLRGLMSSRMVFYCWYCW